MSAGPPRPFVSVKFTPAGRTYSFLLPDSRSMRRRLTRCRPRRTAPARRRSRRQDGRGPALGTVTRTAAGARRSDGARPPDSRTSVVRRATRDDVVQRLKQQQREQEAQRVCAS